MPPLLEVQARQGYIPSVSDEKDTCQDSGKSSLTWTLWCGTALLLMAYPLSIGPVAKFYTGSGSGLDTFYAPVIHLYQTSPPVHRFFDWYMDKVWRID